MKTAHRWLKSILYSAMLVLLVSCASTTYIPTESSVGNMSVKEARNVLTQIDYRYNRMYHNDEHADVTEVRVTSRRALFTDKSGKQSIFIYRELPNNISVTDKGERTGSMQDVVMLADQPTFIIRDSKSHAFANALYVLKQNAIKQKKEADAFDANFAASLADYRNKAASNAALPEAANKYKVPAEGAVRDKAFDDAADFYAEALKIAPWWPAGHFNRALVLGETGDYGDAKREMKHYLQLVPDAPNARAAQDKIYDWERMESK